MFRSRPFAPSRLLSPLVVVALTGVASAQLANDDIQPESIGASFSAKLEYQTPPPAERGPVSLRPSQMELVTEPPTEFAGLPQLSGDHRFGYVRLGRTGRVYAILDKSDPSSRWYDLLYLDVNTNRDFRDDKPFAGRSLRSDVRDMDYTEFSNVTMSLYYGKNTNESFTFTFYIWYPRDGVPTEVLYTASSWREGTVEIDGQTMRVGVFDNDNDGMFTIKHILWSLVPEEDKDQLFTAERTLPAAIPVRVAGVPYRITQIMPEGRHVELSAESESRAREAELSYLPIHSEPIRPKAEDGINWASDIDQALRVARGERKKVLVLLAVDWSRECHNMLERTFSDKEVVQLLRDHYVCVQVNPDREPDHAERFEIAAAPTTLILNRSGDAVERVVGYRQARTMASFLRRQR